jgi:DNA-binding NarL/FixJ family response regulator
MNSRRMETLQRIPYDDPVVEGMVACECGRRLRLRVSVFPPASVRPSQQTSETRSPLSAFEAKVLERVAAGMTDSEVAHQLGVSISSVRYAIRSAIGHLAARNRPQAVFKALSAGYLQAG